MSPILVPTKQITPGEIHRCGVTICKECRHYKSAFVARPGLSGFLAMLGWLLERVVVYNRISGFGVCAGYGENPVKGTLVDPVSSRVKGVLRTVVAGYNKGDDTLWLYPAAGNINTEGQCEKFEPRAVPG